MRSIVSFEKGFKEAWDEITEAAGGCLAVLLCLAILGALGYGAWRIFFRQQPRPSPTRTYQVPVVPSNDGLAT
jgi:hypothetical protein